MANPNWKPGVSGNPNGRPPSQRALTEILKRAGNKTLVKDGKRISRKRVLAEMAWNLATTGQAQFLDGKELVLDPVDWWQVVKFIYQHIDGGAPQNIDLTSKGNKLSWAEFVGNDNANPGTDS